MIVNGLLQPFDQLTTLTDVAEGTVVRVITRLDETCREVRDAARVIGDAVLMKKMEEAQMKIKRDSECLIFSECIFRRPDVVQLYLLLVCISKPFGRFVTSLYTFRLRTLEFHRNRLFYPLQPSPCVTLHKCHPLLLQMNQPIQLEELLLMIVILSTCNPLRPIRPTA
jgi:hypothetical protein